MSDSEKPVGSKLGWQVLNSNHPYQNPMFKLREDRLRIHDGAETTYTYMERSDAVIVVPITRDGKMILIRQYRYPVDDWCLEVTAGGSHDTGDATLEEIVRKEMQEEIGATCEEVQYITCFYTSGSITNEKCHVYLALGVEMSEEQHSEETEDIQIQVEPIETALDLARRGAVKTGPCALAMLLCEYSLRERGLL
ncbi:MAG TPA: NUDIX hydrolase [Abditibacteriaceae bacterium]|jgi:ADP-ribose pyrophosphatase